MINKKTINSSITSKKNIKSTEQKYLYIVDTTISYSLLNTKTYHGN